MRAKWYAFLSLFGYKPKLSEHTGFVMVDTREQFLRALRKYLFWMLLTSIASGAAEFIAFILAFEITMYGGWASQNILVNILVAGALLLVPVIITIVIHAKMYVRMKSDDSRMGPWHCVIFLVISLLAVAPGIYLGYLTLFGL